MRSSPAGSSRRARFRRIRPRVRACGFQRCSKAGRRLRPGGKTLAGFSGFGDKPGRAPMHRDKTMHYLKVLCGFGFLVVLASNLWSISGWNEIRGVYDDLCYLRQAHLFQKSGLRGLDTNIALEDDHYLSSRLKEIDFPTWSDPATAPCHNLIPATKKLVIQYPPGTGFVLALFPEGSQVVALYVLTSLVAFGFALAAMVYASSLL